MVVLVLAGLFFAGVRFDPPATNSPAPSPTTANSALPVSQPAAQGPAGEPEPGESASEPGNAGTKLEPLLVAAGGDVIGDRQVGVFIDRYGGEAVFADVRELLRDADVAFVNLESPASNKGSRNTKKDVTFRGRPALVAGLRSAGIDAVSLANNHALDWGGEALLDTLARLEEAGIAAAGAGADLAAARRPAIVETQAGRVALLAYSNVLPEGFPAGNSRPGVNPGRPDRERVLADITAAAVEADWVLVSFHWGREYQPEAAPEQQDLARAAVDAGADLVLGHHPHVIQGLELYRDRLIAYSLGDFVFDHYSRETGEAFVLRVTLEPQGPPAAEVVPVYLTDGHGIPEVVDGKAADRILSRLERLSSSLGVRLVRDGNRSLLPSS